MVFISFIFSDSFINYVSAGKIDRLIDIYLPDFLLKTEEKTKMKNWLPGSFAIVHYERGLTECENRKNNNKCL